MAETYQQEQAEISTETRARDPFRRRALRRLWRAQNIYFIVLAAFTVLALFARAYAYFAWDLRLELDLQSIETLRPVMLAASLFGNGLTPFILTGITIFAFLFFRRRSEAASLLLSTGGGELVNRLVKYIIARPRPTANLVQILTHPATESFPSGHVNFYVCYFGFLFFVAYALLNERQALRSLALALLLLPILLIGFSRVYLGAHWPSDVLGAYLLAGLWLALSLHLYRHWKKRVTFHPEEKSDEKH